MKAFVFRIYARKNLLLLLLSLVSVCFTIKANMNGLNIETDWDWNTFMGSSSDERGRGITMDTKGNVYVVGYSGQWGSPVNNNAGWIDAFVAKLNRNGELLWHTFMGGGPSMMIME